MALEIVEGTADDSRGPEDPFRHDYELWREVLFNGNPFFRVTS
jgi:hypothetical protein